MVPQTPFMQGNPRRMPGFLPRNNRNMQKPFGDQMIPMMNNNQMGLLPQRMMYPGQMNGNMMMMNNQMNSMMMNRNANMMQNTFPNQNMQQMQMQQ